MPARLHRSDTSGYAILFSFYVPLFFHHLVSQTTHCYEISKSGFSLKRSLILPICTSIVCGSASVSYPHTSSISCCFVNVLPGEAAKLVYKQEFLFVLAGQEFHHRSQLSLHHNQTRLSQSQFCVRSVSVHDEAVLLPSKTISLTFTGFTI